MLVVGAPDKLVRHALDFARSLLASLSSFDQQFVFRRSSWPQDRLVRTCAALEDGRRIDILALGQSSSPATLTSSARVSLTCAPLHRWRGLTFGSHSSEVAVQAILSSGTSGIEVRSKAVEDCELASSGPSPPSRLLRMRDPV